MTTAIFDLDQQRCEAQAAIAESLLIDGESDGFDGIYPTSSEPDYMLGYLAGCRRKMAEVMRNAALLEEEAAAVEAMVAEF